MNHKQLAILVTVSLAATAALAKSPTITLQFVDPQGLCKDNTGKTKFSFNYQYLANDNIEYYSGPVFITTAPTMMTAPLPPDGELRYYTNFEITSQGDCGQRDLDYRSPGQCYLANLISPEYQQSPYSYRIILTPKMSGEHAESYRLGCQVIALSGK